MYEKVITTPEDSKVTRMQVYHNNGTYACVCDEDDSACDKLERGR